MPKFQLKRHKIQDVPFVPARNTGGVIEPELVVLHDTAGRLDAGSSVNWLKGNPGKSSAHFVVELDGSVTQMVPTNRRANHAGRSHYHGVDGVNGFSIGIEIVNPGRMRQGHDAQAVAWWGQEFCIKEYGILPEKTPEHGDGWWMPYTQAQIDTVLALLTALFDGIETLRDIRTHWYVSPGRKVDTNPLFPLDHVRAAILGRDEPADASADDYSFTNLGTVTAYVDCPGDVLNLRRWPSFNPNIIGKVPHGTKLQIARDGVFAGRSWSKVAYGGAEGWVVDDYLKKDA